MLTLSALLTGCAASTAASVGTSDPPATSSPLPAATASAPVAPVAPVATESAPPPAASPAPVASSAPEPPASAAPATAGSLSSAVSKGEAAYYTTSGKGSCALNPPGNVYVLSAARDIYQNVQACGACLEITGGAGTAVVQVMDYCHACAPGSMVINKPAFEAIVGKQSGKGEVSWKTVACPVGGNVNVRIKEGSTRDWTAVQIRDSKYPLKGVSMKRDGASDWVALERSPDNYWSGGKGAGDGGFSLQITAVTGQQIEETVAKRWTGGKVYPGAHQF